MYYFINLYKHCPYVLYNPSVYTLRDRLWNPKVTHAKMLHLGYNF